MTSTDTLMDTIHVTANYLLSVSGRPRFDSFPLWETPREVSEKIAGSDNPLKAYEEWCISACDDTRIAYEHLVELKSWVSYWAFDARVVWEVW